MAKKVLINDPVINELTYDVIFNATREERQKLSQTQLRQIKTERRARQFCINSTLDEKLILLAKLGIAYTIKLGKKASLSPKHLKQLFEKYKENVGHNCIDDLHKSSVAVTTDRHVTKFHNMLGNLCHSDVFMINRDYYKTGNHILNWKASDSITSEEVKQTDESLSVINKLTLNISMALKEIKGITKIGDLDFNILSFLFSRYNEYVEREKLVVYFRAAYKMTIITAALKRLVEGGYIEKAPDPHFVEYLITSLGIDAVMSFHRKVMTDTLEY